MIRPSLERVRTILALGAHPDDIEIGAGGTLLRLLAERDDLAVHLVVFSGNAERKQEATRSADVFLRNAAERSLVVHGFRDTFFPAEIARIKECFNTLGRELSPDLILTHRRDDLHQDHRTVGELTWNTFRDHLIFEYDIPKYEGDFGEPNVFVPLGEETCAEKVGAICEIYESQKQRQWFSEDAFWATLRLRGIGANERFAEGFTCRKWVV